MLLSKFLDPVTKVQIKPTSPNANLNHRIKINLLEQFPKDFHNFQRPYLLIFVPASVDISFGHHHLKAFWSGLCVTDVSEMLACFQGCVGHCKDVWEKTCELLLWLLREYWVWGMKDYAHFLPVDLSSDFIIFRHSVQKRLAMVHQDLKVKSIHQRRVDQMVKSKNNRLIHQAFFRRKELATSVNGTVKEDQLLRHEKNIYVLCFQLFLDVFGVIELCADFWTGDCEPS